jgi:hypothetical protein
MHAVIVEGLGPLAALELEGKVAVWLMRSSANACSASVRVKPRFTPAAISCSRVNSGVRYEPPGRSELVGAAAAAGDLLPDAAADPRPGSSTLYVVWNP